MPLYEYKCQDCGCVSEFLQGVVQDEETPVCRNCGSTNLVRLFSTFAVGSGASDNSPEGSCCGLTAPCENPKRCCEKWET